MKERYLAMIILGTILSIGIFLAIQVMGTIEEAERSVLKVAFAQTNQTIQEENRRFTDSLNETQKAGLQKIIDAFHRNNPGEKLEIESYFTDDNANANANATNMTTEAEKTAAEILSQAGFTDESNTGDKTDSQIVLLSQKMGKANSYTKPVLGQVKNIGNATAEFIEIGLTAYNKDGEMIGTGTGYPAADTLKPGQKSTFEISLFKDDFKGMKTYELSLEWRDFGSYDQSEYIENVQVYGDTNGQ
jgi:hypothetical protein